MSNIAREIFRLFDQRRTAVAEVEAIQEAEGTSIVLLPSGENLLVRGTAVAVGQNAYIENGAIVSAAPNLPMADLEV